MWTLAATGRAMMTVPMLPSRRLSANVGPTMAEHTKQCVLTLHLCRASGSSGFGAGSAAVCFETGGVVGVAVAFVPSAAAVSGAALRCRFASPSVVSLWQQMLMGH